MTTDVQAPASAPPAPKAPGRPHHPLRAELLRGFAPWSGLAALLSMGGLMASKAAQWQGSWPETMSNLHLAAAALAVPSPSRQAPGRAGGSAGHGWAN